MDRTQAGGYFTSGGKRLFRDRDLAAGIHGTEHRAADRNAVQEEIMAVQEAAGLTPDAANWTQLLQALRRLFGGGLSYISASRALILDDAGLVTLSAAAGALSLPLPAANALSGRPIEFEFVRWDGVTGNAVTLVAGSGDNIDGSGSLTLPPGARLRLRSDGSGSWLLISGRETLRAPQLASAGYVLVPNGLHRPYLRQWARLTVPGPSSGVTWTFPLAFTEGCYGAHATPISTGGGAALTAELVSVLGTPTTTQVTFDNQPGTNAVEVFVEAWGV